MFTLAEGRPVRGVPLLHAALFIPPGGVTDDQIAELKRRWREIYAARDDAQRFIFVVDITHPSLQSLEAAWVVPHVVEVIKETRPLAERQLDMTVIVTGTTGRRLIAMVDALFKLLPYVTAPSRDEAPTAAEAEYKRRDSGAAADDPWYVRMLQ